MTQNIRFLQRDLILRPVNVEEKHFIPVRTVVHGIGQSFLKNTFIDRFEDKAVGKRLKDLIHLLPVIGDIKDQRLRVARASGCCCLNSGNTGKGDVHQIN